MDYFIVGSGSYVDQFSDVGKVPKDSLKFFFADSLDIGGFAFLDISDERLKFVFVDSEGTERYEYSIQPRKLENK